CVCRPGRFLISSAPVCVCARVQASAKRFRVTGTGKIVRRCAGKQHLLSKKNAKRRKRLSKMVQVNKSDYSNVMGALPYLKVNKKAG
uniref:50S ribosomal protein L35 n=1 Tax=Aegilops tauschii subsp. strangulata TaxID=200361 RepID=A0A453T5K4_AEGTS